MAHSTALKVYTAAIVSHDAARLVGARGSQVTAIAAAPSFAAFTRMLIEQGISYGTPSALASYLRKWHGAEPTGWQAALDWTAAHPGRIGVASLTGYNEDDEIVEWVRPAPR